MRYLWVWRLGCHAEISAKLWRSRLLTFVEALRESAANSNCPPLRPQKTRKLSPFRTAAREISGKKGQAGSCNQPGFPLETVPKSSWWCCRTMYALGLGHDETKVVFKKKIYKNITPTFSCCYWRQTVAGDGLRREWLTLVLNSPYSSPRSTYRQAYSVMRRLFS